MSAHHLHSGRTGSAITVHVTPGALKNEITDILEDGTIKICVAVPKNGHQANENEMLIRFLMQILAARHAQIEIVAGMDGPDKLITILDMDTETVHALITSHKK
jgi:uncharacterized protein YggU (UPF0235/DUF167 family)